MIDLTSADYLSGLVTRIHALLARIPVAGKLPPIYGANYPYGRPVVSVALESANGARCGRIIATDVYGFQFESPRFFDSAGAQIV
jgi:hypothetical protein